jgi:hypothetical protein
MENEIEAIRKANEAHTKLAVFFAKRLVEIEARQMGFEFVVAELGKLDLEKFGKEIATAQAAMHTAAESRFLQRLKEDPDLAWLNVELRSDTLH